MKKVFLFVCAVLLVFACEKAPENVPVTSVSINQLTAEMVIGETIQLSATVLPAEATDKSVTWSSSNKSVAMVENGTVVAIAEGSSTITASAGGKSGTCAITVRKKTVDVTSVELNKTELALVEEESETLTATVKPDDATDKTVTWSSSDETFAKVESGKVTAIKEGTATITAKAGDKSASCKVVISKKVVLVESVELNKTTLELVEGDSEILTATVTPDNATDQAVTWSTSNASIATIEDGKVTAIKEGEATITAKAGDKSATCKVIVAKKVIPVTSVELNKTELALQKGQSETLTATVKPDDATSKKVIWSTSDSNIAEVDQDGKVTAVGGGKATVAAKIGELLATCVVTVTVPVTSITISRESLTIVEGESETLTASVIPEDATEKTVIWATSNAAIATVDNGKVTAIKEGTAIISVTSGEVSANCEVKVITPMDLPISFADSGIKGFLVDAFDTNNDGELSFREAAAVTSIAGVFGVGINRSFTSFDEFQYFTGVTTVPYQMFSSWSNLESIILPESISSIEGFAFDRCTSLMSIIIPNGVTEIGGCAFIQCYSLTSIVLPESLVRIGNRAFYYCISLESIEIPDGVTEIPVCCFAECYKLSSVILPEKLRKIGDQAFDSCAIENITLPERLSTIGLSAFCNCNKLTTIEIPNGVTDLDCTFGGCTSLVTVILPESIINLDQTFYNCTSLTTIKLPTGLKNLDGAFSGCSGLTTISIPSSVTNLDGSFSHCSSLITVEMPIDGAVWKLNRTFNACEKLTSITIPENVTVIGENTFANCGKLDSVTIPKKVSSIGYCAFADCSGLQEVVINSTSVPSGDYDMFLGSTCPIYVPSELLEAYKAAQYWSEYADRIKAIQ